MATTTVDGTDYVVLPNRTLVPVNDYRDRAYGPAETRTLAAGDTFDYRGNATTVATVTDGAATLEWTAPAARSEEVSEGDTVDLAGDTYVAHFSNPRTLVLDSDLEAYEAELAVQDTYDERINGLWGVSLLSTIAVVLLLGLSYLPSRY